MKFKKQQLRVFDVYPCCDECNEVLEENKDVIRRGWIVYTCPTCKKNYYFDQKYPKRIFEKMGNPIPIER